MKKAGYYRIKYPMNFLQKKAHKDAVEKTKQHVSDKYQLKVRSKDIDDVLYCMNFFMRNLGRKMRYWKAKDPSVVHFYFGYYRVIYPKLFIDMHAAGEFTDEEFDIIRNEFYKKEFDNYYSILNRHKQWLQKQKP